MSASGDGRGQERPGRRPSSSGLFYLWVTLWAAYYFTRRVLAVQVAFILAAHAVTLAPSTRAMPE